MWRAAQWRVAATLILGLLLLRNWQCSRRAVAGGLWRPSGALVEGRELPLIFIGGVPRSGTTLLRVMLDAHPDVRCGQETRVVPIILQMHELLQEKEIMRLEKAGIDKDVLDNAIASFCLEVIVRHGESAPRFCSKDPFVLRLGNYVLELFPNAKFVFMVRDGRATVHSIITRKVYITGFNLNSYSQCFRRWNEVVRTMYDQCEKMGANKCLLVRYETLVLRPAATMRRVLDFLELPWTEAVLHHQQYINQSNGITLSSMELSSDQVMRPLHLDALSNWVDKIPAKLRAEMDDLAPMLSVLGYDPLANPPRYESMINDAYPAS